VPQPTTVVILDLLPGARAYTDTHRDAPPILVIDTGPTELQLSVPGDRVSPEDLQVIDLLQAAIASYRAVLVAHLDFDRRAP
jgi:hypothetical protein